MKKSNYYGVIGSTLSCGLLLLWMWFYVMPYTQIVEQIEDEGLLISFGDSDTGGGQGEDLMGEPTDNPSPADVKETTTTKETVKPAVVLNSTTVKTSSNNYMTQAEASIALEEKNKRNQAIAEQQAIDNARIANEKRIADKRQREQEATNKANSAMSGLFGNSTTAGNGNGSGTGSGTGEGHQGNPVGKGYSGGNSWSLNGRTLTGRLASPSYDKDVEGKVTVNIRVNENGTVVSATIGSPTTISDAQTRSAAIAAAKSTRFSAGSEVSTGSITYNFKLN